MTTTHNSVDEHNHDLEPLDDQHDHDDDEVHYCRVHPETEATLRCNRCGRYMCTRCAVRTPVGYRCRECVYQQQGAFYKATERETLLAVGVALALSIPAGLIIPRLFIIGVLLLSFPAGGGIAEVAFRMAGRKKSRNMKYYVTGAIIAGALVGVLPTLWPFLQAGIFDVGLLTQVLLMPGLYAALAAGAAFARLR